MCKEMTEEQLRFLEETEDPNELRRLLDEIGACTGCSCGRSPELEGDGIRCLIHHQVKFRNRLLHIFDKMGL
jgi:hypothetical protein